MIALLCKSDFKAARNSAVGNCRSSRATSSSDASSRSGTSSGRGRSDTSIACTTSSNCNARERLGMGTAHLRPQTLHRAQLQLLDGPRGLPQPYRNFPDASLLHEPLQNHLSLHLWKLPHQTKQPSAILDRPQLGRLQSGVGDRLRRIVRGRELPRGSFSPIDDGIRCDSQQPSRERHSAPLITRKVRQRFVKHLGRHIFRGCPVTHTPASKRVYSLENKLVEHITIRAIALRRPSDLPL